MLCFTCSTVQDKNASKWQMVYAGTAAVNQGACRKNCGKCWKKFFSPAWIFIATTGVHVSHVLMRLLLSANMTLFWLRWRIKLLFTHILPRNEILTGLMSGYCRACKRAIKTARVTRRLYGSSAVAMRQWLMLEAMRVGCWSVTGWIHGNKIMSINSMQINSAGSVLAGTCLCLCLSRVLYVVMSAINCERCCCISV